MKAQEAFSELLEATGKDFTASETSFLAYGNIAEKFLANVPDQNDPLFNLIRQGYLAWLTTSKQDIDGALAYVETLPKRLERTPVTQPPPTGVAAQLEKDYGVSPAYVFAIRLAKGAPMENWLVWASLFYINNVKLAELNPALIRFIGTTENDDWRAEALNAIKNSQDPDLKQKILAEEAWLKAQNKTLVHELGSLRNG